MNEPRKHHYIPVFYLRQWAGADGRICEYRRVLPNRIVTRRTFPDGTGYKQDLYRIDGVPNPLSQAVEREFMRMVDTLANSALQKLVSGDVRMDPFLERAARAAGGASISQNPRRAISAGNVGCSRAETRIGRCARSLHAYRGRQDDRRGPGA